MDLANGTVGPETSYDVAFTGGSLVVTGAYKGVQAGLNLTAYVSAAQLITALTAKLTNPTELALVAVLEGIIAKIG